MSEGNYETKNDHHVEETNSTMSTTRTLFQNFENLDCDLQSHVLSFATESELWLMTCSQKGIGGDDDSNSSRFRFQESVTNTLATKTAIHFSFLLQLFPNSVIHGDVDNSDQQIAVAKLLGLLYDKSSSSSSSPKDDDDDDAKEEYSSSSSSSSSSLLSNLQYLECCNLRNLSGKHWLPQLPSSLQTLDLSGCVWLDPDVLASFLLEKESSKNLKHLNLRSCVRVGNPTVTLIADLHTQLESLSLGLCSQTIDNQSVHPLLQRLTKLKHLDLQSLNNVSDLSGQFMANLPESIESLNVSSCKQLLLAGLEALEGIQFQLNQILVQQREQNNYGHWANAPQSRHRNVMHLGLDAVGSPRVGLCRGILAYFAMGRQLREVYLTGGEHIQDWEVEALAVTCAATLTCFQMRGCRIGNRAIQALATHCQVLAEVDVSACFRVSDEGIMTLCHPPSFTMVADNHKRGRGRFRLRVLRVASLPGLTSEGVRSIGNIDSLHVLDVGDCIEVRAADLVATILRLPHLIDVNFKGTSISGPSISSLPSLLRETVIQNSSIMQQHTIPLGLKMVNKRSFSWGDKVHDLQQYPDITPSSSPMECCSVRTKAQRLDAPIPLALMYHCVECHLLPSVDRGICACCVSKCHKGHQTFVGSWTRFYCDCPFGIAGNDCNAIFPPVQVIPTVAAAVPTTYFSH